MGRTGAWLPFTLILTLPLGCGPASPPPMSPGTSASGPSAAPPHEDGTITVKEVMDALPPGAVAVGGASVATLQVGSHRLKIEADVPVVHAMQDERATVRLGGQMLVIEFAKQRVLRDEIELAKLPAGVKEVEACFVGGKLTIKADGVAVRLTGDPK